MNERIEKLAEHLERYATFGRGDRSHEAAGLLREQHAELDRLYDRLDYTEKGIAEWRSMALHHMQQAKAAQATARVAICHLKAVLAECAYDPVRADMEAQDWLASIGATEEEAK